ncbi:MAG: hypothetical protein ACXVZV_00495 [Terriglobales bacterium]
MADKNQDPTLDRRDVKKEGSSLSGSTLRNNISTEKALHPEQSQDAEDSEIVDQDPGERQKENQNQSKDDPLAA